MKKWEDAMREKGVVAPPASTAQQLTVAQLIELNNAAASSAGPRSAADGGPPHDSFLSDLSF